MFSDNCFVLGLIGPYPDTKTNPPTFVASEHGAIGGGARAFAPELQIPEILERVIPLANYRYITEIAVRQ